jgi:hypothetical protein
LTLAAAPACASSGDRRGGPAYGGYGGGQGYGGGRGGDQQFRPERDAQRAQRGEEQRQRLSPEERRQLRRDVQDAGREIYPSRR